ncbi:uncharacterized protein YecT (DUF1311 family) [Paraburkholderia sp. GAS448]
MRRRFLIAVPLLMSGGLALAADVDCRNPLDQASMNVCAERDFKVSDRKLNETYRALSAKTS